MAKRFSKAFVFPPCKIWLELILRLNVPFRTESENKYQHTEGLKYLSSNFVPCDIKEPIKFLKT